MIQRLNIVNKFFLIGFVMTLTSFASTLETVIILEVIAPRGKVMSKDVVIIGEGSVMVNKEKLSSSEIITQSEYISKIATFPLSKRADQCESGIFKHMLKKGNEYKVEYGCLNSERFKHLEKSFRGLKKDRVTE